MFHTFSIWVTASSGVRRETDNKRRRKQRRGQTRRSWCTKQLLLRMNTYIKNGLIKITKNRRITICPRNYEYTHTHAHAHAHTRTHTQTHTYTHTHTHTYTYINTHIRNRQKGTWLHQLIAHVRTFCAYFPWINNRNVTFASLVKKNNRCIYNEDLIS